MKLSVLSILVTAVAAAALPAEKPNKGRYRTSKKPTLFYFDQSNI